MSSSAVLKLLAIDDEPQYLDLLTAALAREELEILTAQDPEQGFEIFLKSRPRIVVLDLVMPKMSGIELLERIMNVDPGTDVILVTAHYTAESAVDAIQKGATDYLTKPLEIAKLRSRIASLLADAELRRRTLQLDQELVDAYNLKEWLAEAPSCWRSMPGYVG
jgi:two-component system, NtrC family, response regulator HydG